MTFKRFEEIVKQKYPKAQLFKHGEMAGNCINVAVVFEPNTKVYQYNGNYCEVLNKLGIKAIYKHHYENKKRELERLKSKHGKPIDNMFIFADEDDDDCIVDYSKEIEWYTNDIADIEQNYVIV